MIVTVVDSVKRGGMSTTTATSPSVAGARHPASVPLMTRQLFQDGLDITRGLAAADPQNPVYQHDLSSFKEHLRNIGW